MTENTREIPVVNNRKVVVASCLVSAEDFLALSEHVWILRPNGYAARTYAEPSGRKRLVYMHRQVLGLAIGDSRRGDHVNRNKLDNRRSNLRFVNSFQNALNTSSHAGASSGFRGVCWIKRTGRWRARCRVAGHVLNLGEYADEHVAAQVVTAVHRAILRLPAGALQQISEAVA